MLICFKTKHLLNSKTKPAICFLITHLLGFWLGDEESEEEEFSTSFLSSFFTFFESLLICFFVKAKHILLFWVKENFLSLC